MRNNESMKNIKNWLDNHAQSKGFKDLAESDAWTAQVNWDNMDDETEEQFMIWDEFDGSKAGLIKILKKTNPDDTFWKE